MFRRTLQQKKQFKDGAYINYGKQGHFTRDYRGGQSNYAVKGTRLLEYNNADIGMLRKTKECLIKHFIFCYNNAYQIHKDAKYGASYQL